ncbi:hypothetical protein FJZ27_00325 [Candidatus Peribacteria bacterium]|nr:hypothetical protein [Candidatus Peribacteria bacterium]
MPSPTLRRLLPIIIAIGCMLPMTTAAYMTPEEVLLSSEFYLPPSKRGAKDRVARQRNVSTERRVREQEAHFVPAAAPEEIPEEDALDEEVYPSEDAASADLSASDLDLLRTIRLLDRITDRQRVLQYGAPTRGQVLLGNRPDLAPTGAGAWVAATTLIGAVGWTLRRAKRSERQVL